MAACILPGRGRKVEAQEGDEVTVPPEDTRLIYHADGHPWEAHMHQGSKPQETVNCTGRHLRDGPSDHGDLTHRPAPTTVLPSFSLLSHHIG